MSLQNYTSQISVNRSIMMIEQKLIDCGVTDILKKYDNEKRIVGMQFIYVVNGIPMVFKLPAEVGKCEAILRSGIKRPRPDTLKKVAEQAERTAWKILYDWVCAQMTMIQLAQVEFLQVFMSYLYSPVTNKTYFEIVKEKGVQKLLPEAVVNK